MDRIKILFVIDKLSVGGSQTQLFELVKRLNRDRYLPFVCCLNRKGSLGEKVERLDVPVMVLDLEKIYGVKAFRRFWNLVRFIREKQINVIHTYLVSANIFGALAGKFSGSVKIITTRKDMGFSRNWRLRVCEEYAINPVADQIVAVSRAVSDVTRRERRISNGKVLTIPNGIDSEEWDPRRYSRDAIRGSHGISRDETLISVIANLSPIKGHEDLIRAAAQVVRHHARVRFLIIGDGALRASLERLVQSLNLSRHMTFTGNLDNVPQQIAMSDFSVLPSYSEGMSNVLLECMAMACPVIATSVGGNGELIQDQRTGLLVPPHEPEALSAAILRLIRKPEEAARMGEEARKRVAQDFSIRGMVDSHEALYSELAVRP